MHENFAGDFNGPEFHLPCLCAWSTYTHRKSC